jgi:hypothetical protein
LPTGREERYDVTEAVSEGTRLLHVGPHKTGTTTLQGALHSNRAQLAGAGVHYAGRDQHSMAAALAAASLNARTGRPPGRMQPWNDLLADVRASTAPRVVLSSEFFANAGQEAAQRTVADLEPACVHVVVTLRPLARIVPSQWQQYVQNRLTASYEDWLDAMFNRPPYEEPTPTFWRRHRHDALVHRWAQAAGTDNVTVVVVDDSDHRGLLHSFEDLLGVERGILQPPQARANRSLTLAETRVLRAYNGLYQDVDLPDSLYERAMRFGAARYLVGTRPDGADRRISTPAWAQERLSAVAAEIVDGIAASGVRVIGDLDLLRSGVDPAAVDVDSDSAPISPELAARTAIGVTLAMHADALRDGSARVGESSTRHLLATVARRGRERLRDGVVPQLRRQRRR